MPIYDYRCSVCGEKTEILHGHSQTIEQACPEGCPKGCGQTLTRMVSAPKIRFSGQGYYETDEKPKDKQRNVLRKEEAPQPASSPKKDGPNTTAA